MTSKRHILLFIKTLEDNTVETITFTYMLLHTIFLLKKQNHNSYVNNCNVKCKEAQLSKGKQIFEVVMAAAMMPGNFVINFG